MTPKATFIGTLFFIGVLFIAACLVFAKPWTGEPPTYAPSALAELDSDPPAPEPPILITRAIKPTDFACFPAGKVEPPPQISSTGKWLMRILIYGGFGLFITHRGFVWRRRSKIKHAQNLGMILYSANRQAETAMIGKIGLMLKNTNWARDHRAAYELLMQLDLTKPCRDAFRNELIGVGAKVAREAGLSFDVVNRTFESGTPMRDQYGRS